MSARPGPARLTLREIVARLGGEAVDDAGTAYTGVASLDAAGPAEISFLAQPRYRARLATTRAGAVILPVAERDAVRLTWLERQGYAVLRIPAVDVLKDVGGTADAIVALCRERGV